MLQLGQGDVWIGQGDVLAWGSWWLTGLGMQRQLQHAGEHGASGEAWGIWGSMGQGRGGASWCVGMYASKAASVCRESRSTATHSQSVHKHTCSRCRRAQVHGRRQGCGDVSGDCERGARGDGVSGERCARTGAGGCQVPATQAGQACGLELHS